MVGRIEVYLNSSWPKREPVNPRLFYRRVVSLSHEILAAVSEFDLLRLAKQRGDIHFRHAVGYLLESGILTDETRFRFE